MKIRLISTDFDGTIYDSRNAPPVPAEFMTSLAAARGQGARWVINTGRELESVVKEIQSCKIDPLPDFIITLERHIHLRGEGSYQEHLDWNRACHADHHSLFRRAATPLKRIREWVQSRFTAQLYGDCWSPLCIIAQHESDADRIHQHAEAECREVPALAVVRNAEYFRFAHTGYSKGTTLGEIARMLGLSKAEVFAAGDHFNDLPMLDGTYAGHVAAPANAIPQVKARVLKTGGFLADRPCGFGTADALDFFLQTAAESELLVKPQ